MKRTKIKYQVLVRADDENRSVLFDKELETMWSMGQITSWLQRKFDGQWKKITVHRQNSNEFCDQTWVGGN
jgi:hypothetical protein